MAPDMSTRGNRKRLPEGIALPICMLHGDAPKTPSMAHSASASRHVFEVTSRDRVVRLVRLNCLERHMIRGQKPTSDKHGKMPAPVRDTSTINPPVTASRYLAAGNVEWQASEYAGFWTKPLYENVEAGERTLLMKVDPGAFAGSHSHGEFEQFYVLEGSLFDDEHELRAGDYCCRAAGTAHTVGSRDGAIVLLVYTRSQPTAPPGAHDTCAFRKFDK